MAANLPLDPTGYEPKLAEANLARIRGQWGDAVDTCVRVLRGHPGNADAHSLLGDIYRDQGARDDAIQWYRMATDLRPDGPDAEKLARLEAERERELAAQSGPLNPSMGLSAYETGSGGATPLMGYSPRRWMNVLTIVSVSFLAATILVLVGLRMSPAGRGNTLARPLDLSSHPSMPTAETGVKLPPVNPNRPAILPEGEQPKASTKPHQTGDGLEPDRPNASRTAPLPTFPAQAPTQSVQMQPQATSRRDLAPAPVHLVRPLEEPAPVGSEGQPSGRPRARTMGVAGQPEDRDQSNERDNGRAGGATKPAPEAGAGEQNSNSGATPPER